MVPLPVSLLLLVVALGCELLYVRAFFGRVEPVLIARVEAALDVTIGFGPLHHWEVRAVGSRGAERPAFMRSAAVAAIQLGVMLAFALGLFAIAAAIFAPPILWVRLRS